MKALLLSLLILQVFSSSVDSKDQTDFYKKYGTVDGGIEQGWVTVDGIPPHATDKDVNKFFYQLFYMKGKSKDTVDPTDPLVIWLNGGPGCSSQLGLYTEIGPYNIKVSADKDKKYELVTQPNPWNVKAHLLFIDQPFGAGLSWSTAATIISNTDIAASYFKQFVYTFLNDHAKLKSNPFYIFGESYAGHYIPAFARAILEDQSLSFVNYKGIGIGDGWTNPLYQVGYYAPYLFSTGLTDNKGRTTTQAISNEAQQDILNEDYTDGSKKFDEASGGDYFQKKVSVSPYNFWQYADPKAPEPAEDYATFLNGNKDVFDIPEFVTFQDCNNTIYESFTEDIGKSRADDILFLLDKGKVLLYNGQLDFIVNTPGALLWINDLNWSKLAAWKKKDKKILKVGEKVLGTYKVYDNLQFATIYQAGHMVPTDAPVAAQLMFNNYITDAWP